MATPISEKATELLTERIVGRIEEANSYTLEAIGKAIKEVSNLTPTKAQQLAQVLKYGNRGYKDIVKRLSELTGKNLRDIEKIFEEVAKKDLNFANQFYKYKNMPTVRYQDNEELKSLVKSMVARTQREYLDNANMSETGLASKMLGFSIRDKNNKIIFKGLQDTYYKAIDDAVIMTSLGQKTKQDAIRKVIRDIGKSGIKKVDYKNGRSVRLDSIVRMHMQSSLRDLHNKVQEQFGDSYGANGIEISVHSNPAPDHALVQGRQFSREQYAMLQEGLEATDYKGNKYTLDHDGKNGYRPISEYNCYHYEFAIILGVSKPIYDEKQLQNIVKKSKEEIEFEGKNYSRYEISQLQRKIETKIREEKDLQTIATGVGDKEEIILHQKKIKELNLKYNQLSKASGLPMKKQRLSVSGYHYRPYKAENLANNTPKTENSINIQEKKIKGIETKLNSYDSCKEVLNSIGIELNAKKVDTNILISNTKRIYEIVERYPFLKERISNKKMKLGEFYSNSRTLARASKSGYIEYNAKSFQNYEELVKKETRNVNFGWHQLIKEENAVDLTITHELGHHVEYAIIDKLREKKMYQGMSYDEVDKVIMDKIYDKTLSNLKKDGYKDYNRMLIKNKWLSKYGKSKRHYEAFAELFSGYILGDDSPLTEALGEYIDEFK